MRPNEPPAPVPDLFRWRRAVASPLGPHSTTRHVLLTLSLHMDRDGGSCFPSTQTLADATGLSERSVCTHLERAERAGWIAKYVAGVGGKGWARNGYRATVPAGLDLSKGTEGGSVPKAEGTEPHVQGTEPHDRKALKEVQSNSSSNSSTEDEARAPARGEGPTLDAVLEVARMRGVPVADATAFFYHYDAMEWTVNGRPLRKWQSKLMQWKHNEHKYARANGRRADTPGPTKTTDLWETEAARLAR